jgi:uncharacterized coiled-coil DUF342 family protein
VDRTARALDEAAARIAELEAALATEQARRADAEADRDRLREAYEALKRGVPTTRP